MTSKNKAVDFLLSIPMFQQVGISALNPSLDKIKKMDTFLASPHKHFKTIHVGGTNGKGSVSHMLCSVLMSAGYKVGLYTSPHLKSFHERIRINGEMISDQYITSFVEETKEIIDELSPSFFEVTTALAFSYFANQKVDIAVIEVGLGGNFDATNIITPLLSIITNVSIDHTNILGNTITEIAHQKSGIIKPNVPVIIGESNIESDTVFNELSKNSNLTYADKSYKLTSSQIVSSYQFFEIADTSTGKISLMCDLLGESQKKNILTLYSACKELQKMLPLSAQAIEKGVESCSVATHLLGRWQTLSLSPHIICDTAHNKAGITDVTKQLSKMNYKQLYFILGMVADKDIDSVLELLPKDAIYLFTKAKINRAIDEVELARRAKIKGLNGDVFNDTTAALTYAKQIYETGDLIFIGGSNFIVSELI